MRVAYFDCVTGAAGDMILGALLDAGASLPEVRAALKSLAVAGWRLAARKVIKHGLAATRVEVRLSRRHRHDHVGLREIRAVLRRSELSPRLRVRAEQVFAALAQAEARIHGIPPAKVHFHEVGAVDAIVDVVGSIAALDSLEVDRVFVSPIPMSYGTVRCEHGELPVPAPATLALLQGHPFFPTGLRGELVTPTAAALFHVLCGSAGCTFPPMTLQQVGHGAGARDLEDRPNVLRVLVGTTPRIPDSTMPPSQRVWVVEASLDDATGEIVAYALERLLAAGALDAHATPVQMKKGRPGLVLTALAPEPLLQGIEAVFLRETTTFGLRRYLVERSVLERERIAVRTKYGPVRVKLGKFDGQAVAVHAEHEDCRRLALAEGVPLKEVVAAALNAWRQRFPRGL